MMNAKLKGEETQEEGQVRHKRLWGKQKYRWAMEDHT